VNWPTLDFEEVDCETCCAKTFNSGTKRCDSCWETERRLFDYLMRGGAKALQFVIDTVNELPD